MLKRFLLQVKRTINGSVRDPGQDPDAGGPGPAPDTGLWRRLNHQNMSWNSYPGLICICCDRRRSKSHSRRRSRSRSRRRSKSPRRRRSHSRDRSRRSRSRWVLCYRMKPCQLCSWLSCSSSGLFPFKRCLCFVSNVEIGGRMKRIENVQKLHRKATAAPDGPAVPAGECEIMFFFLNSVLMVNITF